MEQLKVIGLEGGVLVLATETGERFALPVDETLRSQVRRQYADTQPRTARANPRDIQTQIRAGLSAEEVAAALGIRVEDVIRFEGPVLAEREHIVSQALAVPVLMGADFDSETQPTFGTAVRAKLAEAGASGERWTSWRESSGWIIKVEFTASDVDHDARWGFDPRRSTLSPQNADALQLSRQGSLPDGLIPRLRALDGSAAHEDARTDGTLSGLHRVADPEADLDAPELRGPATAAVQQAAIKRAPEVGVTSAETADLLEALRRRRGQREPMPTEEAPEPPLNTPLALFDTLDTSADDEPTVTDASSPAETHSAEADAASAAPSAASHPDGGKKKGRTSMPSWDEIVFGARTEDG